MVAVIARLLAAAGLAFVSMESAMAAERIRISSEWGDVSAVLADNETARAFARLLPLTVTMTDHLRQEKTGTLPESLPDSPRRRDFEAGSLGLWGPDHVVIYYRAGRVPDPGIAILGTVAGTVAIFDRPGRVTVRIERLVP